MFLKLSNKLYISVALVICISLIANSSVQPVYASSGQTLHEKYNIKEITPGSGTSQVNTGVNYSSMLNEYDKEKVSSGVENIKLLPEKAVKIGSGKVKLQSGLEGNENKALVWDDNAEGYQWTFEVGADGLFQIQFNYLPVTENNAQILRSIVIDGESPFREAESVRMPQTWEEKSKPFIDNNGDEKAPILSQVQKWSQTEARDVFGMYPEPLKFHLTKGTHTLELKYVSGSVAIEEVSLIPPVSTIDYKQYIDTNHPNYEGESIKVQGEDVAERTDRALRRVSASDPSVEPYKLGSVRQNAVGGWNWRKGNDEISWSVDVPKDGLYKLAVRVFQNYNNGIVVYRQILVDGKVPFKELEAYPFYYNSNWATETIGGQSPLLLNLSAGKHTISMRVVTGDLSNIVNSLSNINLKLSDMLQQITSITGSTPDANFHYELDKKIPWVITDMNNMSISLKQQAEELIKACGRNVPIATSLMSASDDMKSIAKSPDTIPMRINDIVNLQSNISAWSLSLQDMTLTIDYLELLAPNAKVSNSYSSFLQKLSLSWTNFIRSFTKNYDSISKDNIGTGKSINVWIARGREWGELLQQMADDEFTPKTGTRVNINILPSGSVGAIGGVSPLMLSIVSGTAPDLALGSDSLTPIELAIRGAVEDLSKFPGYSDVAGRFLNGAIDPLKYNNGVFALPETMDIPLLLYRTDIANSLGIKPPNTWDELQKEILPVLKQSNYDFYINSSEKNSLSNYAMYLYQNEGDFYTPDKKDTALDSDAAYRAFLQWTKNYTVNNMPNTANLYNHFRAGDIPMAVGGLTDYLMLDVAAPELYGRWTVAPIPGTLQNNGVINRSGSGTLTSAIMFKQSNSKQESWEFLKWWTSTSTQENFASQIEATVGPEARWFSANVEAFNSLPWNTNALKVIDGWMHWYKNPQDVLGGYMTPRDVNNAWTRTVLNGENPRDSLEEAVKDIRTEMARKQKEYEVKP